MTAYDWPPRAGDGTRPDARRAREAWNAARGVGIRGDLAPDPEPPAPRGRRRRAVPKAAPSAAADLWQPIGPAAVLGSNHTGSPRITGRIRDVWVEPKKGLRAYAAAATGGIWYTDDGGVGWRAIGGWRPADPAAPNVAANPLATGCLWVEWGRTGLADDPTKDDVWVGTGDVAPLVEGSPGDQLPGIGVLRATAPSKKPETDPVFVGEATNLVGASIFRLARQPGGGAMAAATSKGLFERGPGAPPQATWQPPDGLPKGPKDVALMCTDALWTKASGGQPQRLWVALRRPVSLEMELWWRADGTTKFTQVALPGSVPTTLLGVAASPSHDTLWVLGSGPQLWRVDATVATPAGVAVRKVPKVWGTSTISDSKLAVAVDPAAPARVAVAGTTGPTGAGLFLGAVTNPAAGVFEYPAASHVGDGVHPDVLAVRFTDDGTQVWVACDGGVFVSTAGGAAGTFMPRNTGLEVIEASYVASHPTNDAAVLLGAQDNATQRRVGEALWRWEQGGDGGGIAFDQVATHRYIAQYVRTDWSNGTTMPANPPVQRGASANWQAEEDAAEFYSSPATIAKAAVNQVAVGSNRVWYSQDWGANWVTLPSNTDPMTAPLLPNQDVIPTATGAIRVLRWAGPDKLWVMQARSLHQITRIAGIWQPVANLSLTQVFHPAKKTDVAASDTCNDIAVHDPARGTFGSLYLGLNGDLSADDSDQLWWFDGTSTWFRTGLRKKTTASVTALAVEPGHLDTVYAGTTIGVFRTTVTFNGATPTFAPWTRLDNGLPDVAVQDLSVYSQGPVRLLRAGTQARGVWELDLSGQVADRTYLRVHAYDSRRASPTVLDAPFQARVPDPVNPGSTIPVPYSWHASPDLRVYPKLAAMVPPASLPWTQGKPAGTPADPFGAWRLWRFQTALRKVDRRCEPTGAWDAEFDALLRANGVPTPAGKATITAAYWTSIVKAPNLTQQPWEGTGPSEADLVELLPSETTDLSIDKPSVTVPMGLLTAQVLVHHRGFPVAAAADVQVTLLYRLVPKWQTKKSASWATGAVGWTAAVSGLLTAGTAPALPAEWHLAAPSRGHPVADVAAGAPQAASFELDFSAGVKKGTLALLVAVVHTPADPVALAEVPLRQLVLDRRHVAVRSVLLK